MPNSCWKPRAVSSCLRRVVDAHRLGATLGQPRRHVRRAAAQLDDVHAADVVGQEVDLRLRDAPDAPVMSCARPGASAGVDVLVGDARPSSSRLRWTCSGSCSRLFGHVGQSIARVGIAVRAPRAVVDSDAARTATRAASIQVVPQAISAASAPANASPAPVVSTTSTYGGGIGRTPSRPTTTTPRAPMRDDHRRAGAAGQQPAGHGRIVLAGQRLGLDLVGDQDRLQRDQLAVQRARRRRIDEHGHAALARVARAGDDGVVADLEVGEVRAWSVDLARRRRAARARSTNAPSTAAFAPDATAIWFWPWWSTTISAMPVDSPPRTRDTRHVDASRRSSSIASRPKVSPPTAPTNVTAAPMRAAATAWLAPLPP